MSFYGNSFQGFDLSTNSPNKSPDTNSFNQAGSDPWQVGCAHKLIMNLMSSFSLSTCVFLKPAAGGGVHTVKSVSGYNNK